MYDQKYWNYLDCNAPPPLSDAQAGAIMLGGEEAAAPYSTNVEVTYTCADGWKIDGTETNTCDPATFEWGVTGSDLPSCVEGMLVCLNVSYKIKFHCSCVDCFFICKLNILFFGC